MTRVTLRTLNVREVPTLQLQYRGKEATPPQMKPRSRIVVSFISFIMAGISTPIETAVNTPTTLQPLPTDADIALARESGRVLSAVLKTRAETQQIDIRDDDGTVRTVSIPTSALRLLLDVLAEIGQGNAVSVIPIHALLTTQEAADILNVSRPFLVQLLEKGDIPFHKVGTHRRVRYEHVIAYKNAIDSKRRETLDALAAQAQELGMGY
jgi:excisionase family DNA binding protein